MTTYKIKSHAKINLSLKVLGKLKSGLHKIETLVTFLSLHDEIEIKKNTKNKHEINFYGNFSNSINKNNTVSKLLFLLDKSKYLNDQKFNINIKKNIPQKSGMGGGSMNASAIFNFFIKKKLINLNKRKIFDISSSIGSDVKMGIIQKNFFLNSSDKFKLYRKKLKLFLVLLKPNFGCSTKLIYRGIRSYSKPTKLNERSSFQNISNIKNLNNDLENSAFKKYPILKKMKFNMQKLKNNLFIRMTGSGSTLVAYFKSKKDAQNALKILKKKYKNYWCILSKTI